MMPNKLIPANLKSAELADSVIKEKLNEIEAETQKRKKPSLRQNLQTERLQGLLFASTLNDVEMDKFGKLLDPDIFKQEVSKKKIDLQALDKKDLVEKLAEVELLLTIEQGYAEVSNRAIEHLNHIVEGDEYRKNQSNDNRQVNRNKNFEADNDFLSEILNTLKRKRSPAPLTWDDYEIFKHEVYLNRPQPFYQQEVRIVGEAKDLQGQELEIHKDITLEDRLPWAESRLREFFTSKTGKSPKSK
jgi:hypothetical protein